MILYKNKILIRLFSTQETFIIIINVKNCFTDTCDNVKCDTFFRIIWWIGSLSSVERNRL